MYVYIKQSLNECCTCTCMILTSPNILNKELLPHPFGPHTNTFIPE